MPRATRLDHGMICDSSEAACGGTSFAETLARHKLELRKDRTHTLQVNVGLLCNQLCRHCHLEAGPTRKEIMTLETIDAVADYARRAPFQTVDITGGAPEMNPNLGYLIEAIAPLASRLMLRTNLTALSELTTDHLINLCKKHGVIIVASLPSVNISQTDAQRGQGVFEASLSVLRKLNSLGYGRAGTGLELNLVVNPAGAFLPAAQAPAEAKFRSDLARRWELAFNNLLVFANVPLGRFRSWLEESANLEKYQQKLEKSFNPQTIEGLMCRTLVSVSWDGFLFDCDFNLARTLYLGGRKTHVSEMEALPEPNTKIPTGNHCYACTAGSGFT